MRKLDMPMLNRQCLLVLFVVLLGLPALVARAEPPDKVVSAAGSEPDVMEILRLADAATKAVKALTYEGEFYGVGMLEARMSHIKGTLKVKPGKRSVLGALTGSGSRSQLIRFEGTVIEPGSTEEMSIKAATDGKQVYLIDDKEKIFIQGNASDAGELLSAANALYMREYLFPTPFSDELAGKEVRYEGTKDVGGVECDVLFIVYQNKSESRWFFGKKDHLPRRVDRIVTLKKGTLGAAGAGSAPDAGESAYVIAIRSLDTSPTFAADEFRLKRPKDYAVKKHEANKSDDAPPLLEAGSEAPEWELSTPDGKTVSLKSLRGNVVVMDFWATWCGPCKIAMPGVQKLHEQFEGKPVKVFGISTWERGDPVADPVEYMKGKKYTYGLLVKGDKVAEAYQVNNIPTFYVIGPDGKILHASTGFEESKEAKIAEVIEKNVKAP
jgi:peroxiredoxin